MLGLLAQHWRVGCHFFGCSATVLLMAQVTLELGTSRAACALLVSACMWPWYVPLLFEMQLRDSLGALALCDGNAKALLRHSASILRRRAAPTILLLSYYCLDAKPKKRIGILSHTASLARGCIAC